MVDLRHSDLRPLAIDGLAVIGCGKQKAPAAAPAREMYRGGITGPAIRYCEQRGIRYVLLSGAHGILSPGDVIEPYDYALKRLSREHRNRWGYLLSRELAAVCPEKRCTFLAGVVYHEVITPWLVGWRITCAYDKRETHEIRHLLCR